MPKKATSRTEKESFFEERIFGGHHYKTTITDGKDKVEGQGRTPEEAEKLANDRWSKKKGSRCLQPVRIRGIRSLFHAAP